MVNRRELILTGAAGLLAAAMSRQALAAPPSPADPAGIVTEIYTRAAKGKGDGGGAFIIENKAAKGDVGPIDFDPVTNSQEPDVKSFKVTVEKQDADKASIAVVIDGRNTPPRKPADRTIRYEFVRDGSEWKIDDIKGASDGEPWSIRGMLPASLKN